jgi:tRNA modification GTPase
VRAELWIDGERIDDVLVVDRGPLGVELHTHGASSIWARLSASLPFEAEPLAAPSWQTVLQSAMSAEVVALACEQAGFDFDVELEALAALPRGEAADAIAACLRRSRLATAMIQPTRLVLVGRQNAGKSTLFNRLLLRERSLAGPVPGLTRDAVFEPVVLSGFLYDMVDTAGEGAAAGVVDASAIERGRRLRESAIVVLVVPAGVRLLPAEEDLIADGVVLVRSKGDLVASRALVEPGLRVSAACDAPSDLRSAIGVALRQQRGLAPAGAVGGPAALDSRQWALLAEWARRMGVEGDCGADRRPA